MVTLYQLRQDPGERITAFHSRMRFLWDQVAASKSVIKSVFDAKLLLNRSPLPTVNQVVNDLVREETRMKSYRSSQPHTTVLTTPASVGPTVTAPPKALTASESVPSSDAASFDPVSLTTPTYSIADLQGQRGRDDVALGLIGQERQARGRVEESLTTAGIFGWRVKARPAAD
uniref:Uncharacterized protein n=1 Tax=Fagus sylvatica TaxID=28930 RepID=A0A2N9J0N7_FAGSY